MRTTFSTCVLVNFAVDPHALRRRLPAHLEPDLHAGMAYVSVVIARMEKMRPAFLPRALGITYHQVVYRAVVKYNGERGVTFLRSDADNSLMVAAGNALTFFHFNRAPIDWEPRPAGVRFSLEGEAAIHATYEVRENPQALPSSSRFPDLTSAQAFLSELYVAFGAKRSSGKVEVVRIARTLWDSYVVPDLDGEYAAMSSGLFKKTEASIDSIFLVKNLEYLWNRLSLE
jgi:uncharacterized protein YqjF (DUF2071 family)